MDQYQGQGWVKPEATITKESLKRDIEKRRQELAELEAQYEEMVKGDKLQAIVECRNLMRGFELSWADISDKPKRKRRTKAQMAEARAHGEK